MKLVFAGLLLLSSISFAQAGPRLKIEGQCSGLLQNGSQVEFSYFSNFEGCQGSIASSIKFSRVSGLGYHKGSRVFRDNKDIYTFGMRQEIYRLTFENRTGNISGVFTYLDSQGKEQSVILQCEIRDYEYGEC